MHGYEYINFIQNSFISTILQLQCTHDVCYVAAFGWIAESWPQDGCRRKTNPRQAYFRDSGGR